MQQLNRWQQNELKSIFFREAKTDMRKEYCKEDETDNRQPVESCDIDEIAIAKSWTWVNHIYQS